MKDGDPRPDGTALQHWPLRSRWTMPPQQIRGSSVVTLRAAEGNRKTWENLPIHSMSARRAVALCRRADLAAT
jgi:hypothetical protein